MKKNKEVNLRVMEAMQEEAYKGIVRIDSQDMREIKVRPGDIVEIEGNRKTVGIVDRAYPTDIGESVIRMDGILRRNANKGDEIVSDIKLADILYPDHLQFINKNFARREKEIIELHSLDEVALED